MSESIEKRLWSRVDKSGECWTWTGPVDRKGYGYMYVRPGKGGGVHRFTHRVSYELSTGRPIPDNMLVCHRCDNPPCVRPDHLFLGTQSDNLKDMRTKGRHAVGERIWKNRFHWKGTQHHMSKLTPDIVIEIRKMHRRRTSMSNIALRYGVSGNTVRDVIYGVTWSHVTSSEEAI